jgi:hypothetical protein
LRNRRDDGQVLIFGPSLLHANAARVLLSRLSSFEQPLDRKGPAFEAEILAFFQEQRLHARGFRVTREGEEYEYDAVLAWGGYVFVFECKNRSLSNNRPRASYYFELGIRSAIRQVKRLTEALARFPDILAEQMQIDVSSKTLVPCVLNTLPFARSGSVDGVYCTDASALRRLFENRYVHFKTPYELRANVKVLHRIRILSLWAGDEPTPDDLLAQLGAPFQLAILRAQTELRPFKFAVEPGWTCPVSVDSFPS